MCLNPEPSYPSDPFGAILPRCCATARRVLLVCADGRWWQVDFGEVIVKVLGISGSPRRGGNTEILVKLGLEVLAQQGIETEYLSLADHPVKPCLACGGCSKPGAQDCVQDDPAFEGMTERFKASDGFLIGSPVYFGSATPQTMSLLDRIGYVSRCQGNFLRRKVGAAIVVARRAGQNFTFAQLNYFFLISEMIVPGSTYWNVAVGREKGEVQNDEEGIATVKNLAANMAWLLKKLHADG